jgi:hypothetical protein
MGTWHRLMAAAVIGATLLGAGGRPAEAHGVADMYEIKREDGKVWIAGLEGMNWGGSFFSRQDSFMAGMVEILRCAGRDVTYEDAMGLSAQAFKLTLNKELHPGAAQGHVGYAAFDGDGKPLSTALLFDGDDNPMNFHANAMRVFGIEWSHIDLNPEANPGWREQLLAAVRESVDQGIPIYYMDGEWGLIVGYREDGSAFVCKSYDGGTPGYQEMERPRGIIGDAWWANVASPTREPVPRERAVRESLHSAVIMASMGSFLDGGAESGFSAYELWIRVLEEWEGDGPRQGNGFNYSQLLTSREAAGHYLRGIAEEWGDSEEENLQAAGEHLHAAADRYIAISDRLWEGQDCVVWWDGDWTADDRATEVRLLRECLADERQAISEIEAALGALGD